MVIGVDIGGTKTHLRVTGHGRSAVDRVVPTIDWRNEGLFDDSENAHRLVALVQDMAGSCSGELIVIGAHGCDTPSSCRAWEQSVKRVHDGPVHVVNDAELLIPAAGHEAGIAVISGTGAIVVATDTAQEPVVVGGHGWLLGDSASAPGLVRDAVKSLLRRRDEADVREDVLHEGLVTHFGVGDVTELGYRLSDVPRIDEWAGAAPVVFEAADRGSDLAVKVIEDAARELAGDVALLAGRGLDARFVVCAGGVIIHQPRLFDAVRRYVTAQLPETAVELLTEPPVAGAVALAERCASDEMAKQLGYV